MKNHILTIMFALLVYSTEAQNVYISDLHFKMCLIPNLTLEVNGDGEIQLSEAKAYRGGLFCSGRGIESLRVSRLSIV